MCSRSSALTPRCFNPRLLVDEQATVQVVADARGGQVSTHACSLMSRRREALRAAAWCQGFNPRLLVDEQATSAVDPVPPFLWCFNPRLLVDEQATLHTLWSVSCNKFQPTPAR